MFRRSKHISGGTPTADHLLTDMKRRQVRSRIGAFTARPATLRFRSRGPVDRTSVIDLDKYEAGTQSLADGAPLQYLPTHWHASMASCLSDKYFLITWSLSRIETQSSNESRNHLVPKDDPQTRSRSLPVTAIHHTSILPFQPQTQARLPRRLYHDSAPTKQRPLELSPGLTRGCLCVLHHPSASVFGDAREAGNCAQHPPSTTWLGAGISRKRSQQGLNNRSATGVAPITPI